jgi:tape measure domain-containing protein
VSRCGGRRSVVAEERAVRFDFLAGRNTAGREMRSLRRDTTSLSSTLGAVGGAATKGLGLVAAAMGAAATAGGILGVKTAASMEQATIGFTTMLGSAKKADVFVRRLGRFAASTPFELPGLIESSRLLIGVGLNTKQTMATLQAFGDTAGAVGIGQDNFQRVMLATAQSISAGKIKLGDMNQLMNNGIPIWKLLSRALGLPVPKIQALISHGELLTDDVLPKLQAQMEKDYGGAMADQSKTLTGLWSTFQDTLSIGLANIITPYMGALKGGLSAAITGLGGALDLVSTGIGRIQSAWDGLDLTLPWEKSGKEYRGSMLMDKVMPGPGEWAAKLGGALTDAVGKIDWAKIGSAFTAGGTGLAGLIGPMFTQIGEFAGSVDWFNIGKSVGLHAVGFAFGFVGALGDGLWKSLKEHPWATVFGILSIIPIGRVAGLVGEKLGKGVIGGLLRLLAKTGKAIEKPILGVGRGIVHGLWRGFSSVFPKLGGRFRGAMDTVILRIWAARDKVTSAGFRVANGLIEGIGRAAGKLAKKVGGLVKRITGPFRGAGKWLYDAGVQVVSGLWDGISARWGSMVEGLKGKVAALPGAVKKVLHIESPSKVFRHIGLMITAGLTKGLDSMKSVERVLEKALERITARVDKAKEKLSDLRSARRDLAGATRSAVRGSEITERGGSAQAINSSLQFDARRGKDFLHGLKQLERMGLSKSLLSQIAQKGPESMGTVNALLGSGKGGIAETNRLQKQLNKISDRAGGFAGNAVYGKRIRAQEAVVDRLRVQRADIAVGQAAAHAVLELKSSGSRVDDMLLEVLRRAVRKRGGNVQLVLGKR